MIELRLKRIEYADPLPDNAIKVRDYPDPQTPYQFAVLQYRELKERIVYSVDPKINTTVGEAFDIGGQAVDVWSDWQDVEIAE